MKRGATEATQEERLQALLDEIHAMTGVAPAPVDSATAELVAELERETGSITDRGASERADLIARELPLLHRSGKAADLLTYLARCGPKASAQLTPGDGSASRRELHAALGEAPAVYLWVGHCAYARPDPDLVVLWTASAEQHSPPGAAAPWDTAGLCSKATLGRNLPNVQRAALEVRRYSLPSVAPPKGSAPYRRYLAAVLRCSFQAPYDLVEGRSPVRWYPGWCCAPPRTGGAPAEPPHHTFEVRRSGHVSMAAGLLGIVAETSLLATCPSTTNAVQRWLARNALWNAGRRIQPVDRRTQSVAKATQELVAKFLRERGAS
ncbi:MAG: hypothetical protein HY909_26380 [Deltaproteobacteria bacterium]|nr:hypothetical protein [Deltaproteobacteria bacterium]